jgi:hypothetical protein
VGEEEARHRAASWPATPRDGSGAPAAAATDGIGRAGRGGGRGGAGRGGGRGKGWPGALRAGRRKREGPAGGAAACCLERKGGQGRV